jgi:long-chain acyl-CoA synthetase
MSFLDQIFARLDDAAPAPVLQEVRDGRIVSATGGELLAAIGAARGFLRAAGLQKGDRCGLLAPNSIRWAALDLALMAEGIIAVPLYARQAPRELVAMMKDCSPQLVCCGDEGLRDGIAQSWPEAPRLVLFEEIFSATATVSALAGSPRTLADADPLTIIYTSGTSGEPKGVVLNAGNLNHMLGCTNARLDMLMGPRAEPDRIFHYLPCCFAGSWVLLLTALSRHAVLTFSIDLAKLAEEMQLAAPHYSLNVPAMLERIRAAVDEQLRRRGGLVGTIYKRASAAYARREAGKPAFPDQICLAVAGTVMFPALRKKLGPNLKALICGSAPLAVETQRYFQMLGLPVLQVYGLTETTAICTLDHPQRAEPGCVGPAIPGIEMRLGENEEILVRGPNVFPGYWNRPEETARVLCDGWFHTGDRGEVAAEGNWRIIGRLKNLLILNSGHNIAPEPIEERLLRLLPGAQQVMLVGNNRSYLAAIITGSVRSEQVEQTLARFNGELPHYERIRAFYLHAESFTAENGLLTSNGKLRRDAISARLREPIEGLYRAHSA